MRLGRGETHESVADLIAAAPTTNQMMALALHGDAQAGSRVLPTLGQWGRELADVYQWCRKEAHGAGGSGDLVDRVRLARRLVDRRSAATGGLWPRAAALLGRRALETAITEHDPRLAGVSGRARVLCLDAPSATPRPPRTLPSPGRPCPARRTTATTTCRPPPPS